MHVLVVAATALEAAPIVAALGPGSARDRSTTSYVHRGHDVDLLLTGVGMVAAAVWCSRALSRSAYDLALNVGVCGSFDRSLEPGAVVHVVSERLVELGAEDGERFLTIQELGLLGGDDFPFTGGKLVNASPPAIAPLRDLPAVDGITVNTAHGDERSIAAVARRFSPAVESMEGAAFMYACLVHAVRFAQVRAVSNIVETRNRDAWKLPEAIAALGRAGLRILDAV